MVKYMCLFYNTSNVSLHGSIVLDLLSLCRGVVPTYIQGYYRKKKSKFFLSKMLEQ